MKILLATQKPFSAAAVNRLKKLAGTTEHELVLLEKYKEQSDLENAVKDADALIVRSDKVTAGVVSAATALKIVVRAGAGYDNVDLQSCSDRKIVVMNTPGQNSNAVAELSLGLMIYLARNTFLPGTGSELKGKKLGIHAFGNVGKLVASMAKGFGMEVSAFDPFVDDRILLDDGVIPLKSINELYSLNDIISINIPAMPATVKSINKSVFDSMKENVILVNTARKEVIDEIDLLNAMSNRQGMKYGTDVMPECHEKMKEFGTRYFATPKKMGAETEEANVNAAIAALNQIIDFFATGNEKFRVNK
ncbi:MAG: 3-phosphoglycerate dehydrogenase [Prevotellaceae bacterium]|jgi:D-3-phosphoglycerate dehydrogenase|nr:3-phosphoglycerate dehydrogenase [Prevotellaceae bacterium]